MAARNVSIAGVGAVTVGAVLAWGYSIFGPHAQPTVEVQEVQEPAWRVEVEDAVPMTDEVLPAH